MKFQHPPYIECLVFIYCLLIGAGVVATWGDHPHTRLGTFAFLAYLIPIIVYWFTPAERQKETTPALQYVAILLSTGGYLGSLNALKYLGIAFSLAGFLPLTGFTWIWILSSFTWMPAMTYFLKSYPSTQVVYFRLAFASFASLLLSVKVYRMLKNDQKTT